VLILKVVKVLCFDTLLQVFILKVVSELAFMPAEDHFRGPTIWKPLGRKPPVMPTILNNRFEESEEASPSTD
jgi:hypothetical protein